MRLAHPGEPFHLVTKLDGVGLENLVALGTTHKLLAGKFNGTIDLRGAGGLEGTAPGWTPGKVKYGVPSSTGKTNLTSGALADALALRTACRVHPRGRT